MHLGWKDAQAGQPGAARWRTRAVQASLAALTVLLVAAMLLLGTPAIPLGGRGLLLGVPETNLLQEGPTSEGDAQQLGLNESREAVQQPAKDQGQEQARGQGQAQEAASGTPAVALQEPAGSVPTPETPARAAAEESTGTPPNEPAAGGEAFPSAPLLDQAGHDARERAFNRIYTTNEWGSQESRSGPGSEVGYTTNLRNFIGVVFKAFNMTSLLDSPCGDCNWQPHIPNFDNISYTGVDIVKNVIEADRVKYKDRKNMRFFQVDMASQPLPEGQYDAALCRDMVQHLPPSAGVAAYRDIEGSGAKYLLTSFHTACTENSYVDPGGFRLMDPMQPPFNFSMPLAYAFEHSEYHPNGAPNQKMIGLWKLPALGKGNGQSFLPVNGKCMEMPLPFVVFEKKTASIFKAAGFTNLICHAEPGCSLGPE